MHHQNLEKLKRLRLFGMARALEDLQNLADRGQLDFADQLAMMIDREAADRANAAMQTRLKQARLRQAACFENLAMKPARGLDKSTIRDLFTCRWIGEHRHLIVTGKTGTGTSWLSCALGNQAAREGYSVLYTRLSRLLDDFAVARLGNGVGRLMRKVTKVSVLILDDWAMIDLTATQRRDLMEIIDDRHDRGSIVLASQLPVESWRATIGDPTYELMSYVRADGDDHRLTWRLRPRPAGNRFAEPRREVSHDDSAFRAYCFAERPCLIACVEIDDGREKGIAGLKFAGPANEAGLSRLGVNQIGQRERRIASVDPRKSLCCKKPSASSEPKRRRRLTSAGWRRNCPGLPKSACGAPDFLQSEGKKRPPNPCSPYGGAQPDTEGNFQ